ncbi:hypothetical protein PVK73_27540 [Bacillus thuringiensis]
MWRKEDILNALQKQYVSKAKIAKILTLNKPWNRYKREEFVDVIYEEIQYKVLVQKIMLLCTLEIFINRPLR